jgi:hypothetical protein
MRIRRRHLAGALTATLTTTVSLLLAFTITQAAASTPTFGALIPSTFVSEYHHVAVPEEGASTATLACPAGQAIVSVGGLGAERLIGLTPSPNYTSALATGSAGRGQHDASVYTETTCAPNAQFAGSTFATHEVSKPADRTDEWTSTATCPAGQRAFAGGGYFRDRSGTVKNEGVIFLSGNSPSGDGRSWTVRAVNQTRTDSLFVTARCLPQSSSVKVKVVTYPFTEITPGTGVRRAQGYARCPAGYVTISGGAATVLDGSLQASQSSLEASLLVGSPEPGWFGSAMSRGDNNARLHVVAICGR